MIILTFQKLIKNDESLKYDEDNLEEKEDQVNARKKLKKNKENS